MILGVVGAGTMGAGIAQLGCAAGMQTRLHDPAPEALAAGAALIRDGLDRWAAKGRAGDAAGRLLQPAGSLEELAGCDLVIEAAPERMDLKRTLFQRLSAACGHDAILATNTSSIPVTLLAGAAERPENVVGMHFFNPPPLIELLELIPAAQTGERALTVARAVGEAMGKRVIVAADGPGFLVNRCNRPFTGEGLRLLTERVATPEQIDRICRMGGGFRMGPFELMDLVGVDVNFEVAKSFTELSFGESRWRPSPIQAQLVAAGRLGRKSGHGFYAYAPDGGYRAQDPEPREPGGGDGTTIAVLGDGALADGLRARARSAGYELQDGVSAELIVDARPLPTSAVPDAAAVIALCTSTSLAARGEPTAVGFSLLPPVGALVELTRSDTTPDLAAAAAERLFSRLGFHAEWVDDAPGLVLGRIVCQLINEAWFAIGEGVGSAADVDAGLVLGLNHPRGPVEWGEAIGLDHVVAVLDGLWTERREERYRPAPLLRRLNPGAAAGTAPP